MRGAWFVSFLVVLSSPSTVKHFVICRHNALRESSGFRWRPRPSPPPQHSTPTSSRRANDLDAPPAGSPSKLGAQSLAATAPWVERKMRRIFRLWRRVGVS